MFIVASQQCCPEAAAQVANDIVLLTKTQLEHEIFKSEPKIKDN